ncbi:cation:proton antiporter [Candidatus Saccharibacteria bacterium]|nr:cation:proton antiporter [Candidatus Saccharibacteria bacterium]
MHAEYAIFYQLSIVMGIAAGLSLMAKLFRQPLIIAYIISGILVGPTLLNVIHDQSAFESFSQIGIALLLFIIGLGLNVSTIRSTGKPVIATFGAITLGLGSISYVVSQLFGFSRNESVVMAIAMLFSSTIIIVKSLSDKKEQSRLYGQIAIGILLAEDVVATLALLYVSASAGNGSNGAVLTLLVKGIFLGSALTFVGGVLMPKLSKLFASSQELLYIFALAWVFGVASLFAKAGFSIEIGALFAGVALAHLPYAPAISARLKLLRDFFIVLFFIRLGEQLGINDLNSALIPALVFSVIAIISKPLLTMISLGLLGYTKQTSFKTAVHLSQISEFSIILVVLAQTTGMITRDLTTIIALTTIFTIAISTYLMKYDDELYRMFEKPLAFFERSKTKQEMRALSHYPLVMLGYHEGGYTFVRTFRRIKKRYIVIDYNPDVIDTLEHQHVNHLYGDATDLELLEEIGVRKSELIVSNISDSSTNRMLAKHITSANDKAIFICRAARLNDAEALYEAGAAYVMMPHFIGDEHINSFIQRNGSNKNAFSKYRQQHLMQLAGVSMTLK